MSVSYTITVPDEQIDQLIDKVGSAQGSEVRDYIKRLIKKDLNGAVDR